MESKKPISLAVSALINKNTEEANNTLINSFPSGYAKSLIDSNGNLTNEGIELALECKYKNDIKHKISNAYLNRISISNLSDFEYGFLEKTNIIDKNGRLTDVGSARAIEFLPLKEQCECLGIDIVECQVEKYDKYLEGEILKKFSDDGWNGVHDEGLSIKTAVKGICIDALNEFHYGSQGNIEKTVNIYLEALLTENGNTASYSSKIEKVVTNCFVNANKSGYRSIFNKRVFTERLEKENDGINVEMVFGVINALGLDRLLALSTLLIEKPYTYRSGWPDLTLYDGDKIKLVEVKGRDKLHLSQIRLIPMLKKYIDEIYIYKSHAVNSEK